ncbi:hypothetical protein C482_02736 [Natrialba chahannaoensis JCM 10990]|uniref:Uncharacterized protein n=1 Tax=Natrialba chahannaoensis JCM 10990 TaxID=1227492 RepID=M0B2N6_9EURY|nr:hypothetical protein C482_02736 [Natrialba chahannaoensis JCM 10990]
MPRRLRVDILAGVESIEKRVEVRCEGGRVHVTGGLLVPPLDDGRLQAIWSVFNVRESPPFSMTRIEVVGSDSTNCN